MVTDNLYECLQQWFTLFPQYQQNPFYAFGESYAGKFVPSITRRIHEENQAASRTQRLSLLTNERARLCSGGFSPHC